jgi:ubiquinone/menaquinone biosynthesis C-methylase UbiE
MVELRKLVSLKPSDRVLDIGCRSGEWAQSLANDCAYVAGIGLTEDEVAEASSQAIQSGAANVSFHWAGGEGLEAGLEFPDRAFEWITCRWILHQIRDPLKLLLEIARVLKSPGRLLVVERVGAGDPQMLATDSRISRSRDPLHQQTRTVSEIRQLLTDSGFSIDHESAWPSTRRLAQWIRVVAADESAATRTRRLVIEAAKRRSTDWDIMQKGKSLEVTHRYAAWVALHLA